MNRTEISIRNAGGDVADVVISDDWDRDEFSVCHREYLAAEENGRRAVLDLVCDNCGVDGFDMLARSIRDRSPAYLNLWSRIEPETLAAALGISLKPVQKWVPGRQYPGDDAR